MPIQKPESISFKRYASDLVTNKQRRAMQQPWGSGDNIVSFDDISFTASVASPPPPKYMFIPVDESKTQQHPWTLEEALRLVRGLQPEAKKFGFHVCLGGGVLNTGLSHKDVDLYFLPLSEKKDAQLANLVLRLEGLWGKSEAIGEQVPRKPANSPFGVISHKDFVASFDGPGGTQAPKAPYVDNDVFRKKLKFSRNDGRIDAFII